MNWRNTLLENSTDGQMGAVVHCRADCWEKCPAFLVDKIHSDDVQSQFEWNQLSDSLRMLINEYWKAGSAIVVLPEENTKKNHEMCRRTIKIQCKVYKIVTGS